MRTGRAKPAPKAEHIAKEIRESILSGKMAPGVRLPVRLELGEKYTVSWSTLQKAIDQLRDEGFVETRGRHGTFVSSMPPHLHRYGLVFPGRPREAMKWSRFYYALLQEAMIAREDKKGRVITPYYHAAGHIDDPDYQTLLNDVLGHRLGGLIFANTPINLIKTPVMTQPGLPRVGSAHTMTGVIPVRFDNFWPRAMEHFKARGKTRLGIVGFVPHESDGLKHMMSIAEQFNVEIRPYWTLLFYEGYKWGDPTVVGNTVNLLMRLPADDRPNALLVTDDNLFEPAIAGLVASRIKVPEELEVVTHCNFPNPPPAALPVRRLGFDCRMWLDTCCDLIQKQRRGEPVPKEVSIPALFEEELPTRSVQY